MNHNRLSQPHGSKKMVAALLGLSLAACSATVNFRTEGSKKELTACNDATDESLYGKAKDAAPVESGRALVGIAEQRIADLHKRATEAGGEIDLQRYETVTEIKVNQHSLSLQFPFPRETGDREIIFRREGSSNNFTVGLGAVACQENGHVYPNGVSEAQGFINRPNPSCEFFFAQRLTLQRFWKSFCIKTHTKVPGVNSLLNPINIA